MSSIFIESTVTDNSIMTGYERGTHERLSDSQPGRDKGHQFAKSDCIRKITKWVGQHFVKMLLEQTGPLQVILFLIHVLHIILTYQNGVCRCDIQLQLPKFTA